MRLIQFLFVYILHNSKKTQANCQARCEQTNGQDTDTGLTNRALVGHSFKNFTVNKPYDCHLLCFVEQCRCQGYQMKGQHSCELLDEDRFAGPDDFQEEQGYEYYEMDREYKKTNYLNDICISENCPFFSLRHTAHVQISHAVTGAVRRIPVLMEGHAPSCATRPNKSSTAHARLRMLQNSVRRKVLHLVSSYNSKQRSKSFYQTFCDLTSENGFVWTLLESFSLANRKDFQSRAFLQDYPVSQNSFKWNKFRLSLPIMNLTLSHSTHFRATCNFNTDGLVTTDYLRAKTTDFNFLLPIQDPCVKMEYMNIRGYDCYNCTARFYQNIDEHIHCDSYNVGTCQFTSARNDAVKLHGGEDNFGYYGTINPSHRCTSNDNATTQWWFGGH
ncbi:uncharacterized protein [Acropora muricata]|uniref:uncharacterized protein n=1 Tax=Acropora muricata TaxID=159855 RepID=UPI0034E42287